jgi:hypothetical protein
MFKAAKISPTPATYAHLVLILTVYISGKTFCRIRMDINSSRYGVIFWQSFEITGTLTKLAPTT